MEDCLFCKIVEGKIPANKVYETDKVLAFLDITPVNEGHTLVIPKAHYENLFEIPDDLLAEIAVELKHIGLAVQKATNAGGINIAMNNREAAGQVIPHAHFHVIPRYLSDGQKLMHGRKYAPGKIEEVADKIRNEVGDEGLSPYGRG
ncbi:MAG: HIT family protein [bacterium]|nr:HIT family protein [bacterium]